jgi:cysteine synthase A
MHGFTFSPPTLDRRAFLSTVLMGASVIHPRLARADIDYPMAEANHLVSGSDADWVRGAIRTLWRDREMAGVTPLVRLDLPFNRRISIYLKNEAKSPTGSLKHRVAWALLMSALVDGRIGPRTKLFEASSGNTAIGEAYFARLLGLPFTAVMRPGVSEGKLKTIRGFGGVTEILSPGIAPSSFINQALARDPLAYDLNQFANAEKALDTFVGVPSMSMNMANEIFQQLHGSDHPAPAWFVAGAGSGGTATSIARYLRKRSDQGDRSRPARLAVVDPEDSALYRWFQSGDANLTVSKGSRIEGIGTRGPVRFGETFSLLREGVARMIKVPDVDSIAAMHLVSSLIGHEVGPSTGTNLCGALRLADEMHKRGEAGAIVSIICDDGLRYRDNYYDPRWIRSEGLEHQHALRRIETFWSTGRWG